MSLTPHSVTLLKIAGILLDDLQTSEKVCGKCYEISNIMPPLMKFEINFTKLRFWGEDKQAHAISRKPIRWKYKKTFSHVLRLRRRELEKWVYSKSSVSWVFAVAEAWPDVCTGSSQNFRFVKLAELGLAQTHRWLPFSVVRTGTAVTVPEGVRRCPWLENEKKRMH